MLHLNDFNTQETLHSEFGYNNSHLVWVMSMYLDEPDPRQLAIDALTDQPNDRKLDFIYLHNDERRIVFAQGYVSTKNGGTAPANKASDLNTAAAWLISGDLTKVPTDIADTIRECRSAIDQGEVDQIELVYVHNLTESSNVRDELETARRHLAQGLKEGGISVIAKEIGLEECERLYIARESGILVKDELLIPASITFEESGPNWRAALISLPAVWLYDQFHKYQQPLFSANYRGFLGVSKRRKINSAIKQTAEIINGAQTTGSIGQIDIAKHDLSKVRVLARIVACGHQETVRSIVRFNNTQNEITTWDQYSNTETQKRIAEEFSALGHTYSLKRGFGQSISGLGIEVVAQPLLAFSGAFDDASRGKNTIFDRKTSYNRAFEGKSAKHILFVYALSRSIDQIRADLKDLNSQGRLLKPQEKQLCIARSVRFKFFFMAVIGASLEAILGRKINIDHASFSDQSSLASNKTLEELASAWKPVVGAIFTLLASQLPDDPTDLLRDAEKIPELAEKISAMSLAVNLAGQESFREFISLLPGNGLA